MLSSELEVCSNPARCRNLFLCTHANVLLDSKSVTYLHNLCARVRCPTICTITIVLVCVSALYASFYNN